MDNTADLTANDIVWLNESSHSHSNTNINGNGIISQTQGSPPNKKAQLFEIENTFKLKKNS